MIKKIKLIFLVDFSLKRKTYLRIEKPNRKFD